jgi:ribosomal protein S21
MAKKTVNVSVKPRGHKDNVQRMIKRFMRKCKKERVLERYREHTYYEKPSVKKKGKPLPKDDVEFLDKLKIKEQNS